MHMIKGSWAGQTYALAKCNDSGGKKSRIRRSKEDRKNLVESFIKKYQKLNNGSFPSLNLTHKEVGGSFYTVRELVREVIQENKVLGPAIFTPEQHNPNDTYKQYPIGSISFAPETELLSTNDSHPVTHILPHCFGDGIFTNEPGEVIQKNEDLEIAMDVVSGDKGNLVVENRVGNTEASSPNVTYIEAGLMVETSPLASGSGITYGLDNKFSVANGNSGEKGEESYASSLRNESNDASRVDPQLNKSYDLVDEKCENKVEVPLNENVNNYMMKEGTSSLLNRQDGSEELVLNANAQGYEPEHQSFGERLQINGVSKTLEKNEEHIRGMVVVSEERVISELEESLEAYENHVTYRAADTVEALPLPSITRRIDGYGLSEKSCDVILNENLGEKEESSVVGDTNFQQSTPDLTNAKTIANSAVQQLKNCCEGVIEKPASKIDVPLMEIPKAVTVKEGTILDTTESFGTEVKVASVVGVKNTYPVNDSNTQSSKETKMSSSRETVPKMPIATENDATKQQVDDIKETNPALDRRNLESWETSDKSLKSTNPLLVFFKAFVTAFVNFWSE